ncbi:putative carbonyl reductase [Polychaeton citri CBS 116435]|uniref:Carbonyl reductase n=1 Tax=Polychaeton citri CBS 116435 TaxID=1314669 RepID=A0A9P4Q4B8_9PEZI|nr:putative carbonyl reductase [Polychaeton citri CBS 116435]
MSPKHLVLITGANQGLGYYASQQLAASGDYHVLVGGRDLAKVNKAIESLVADPSYKVDRADLEAVQIDITDDASIKAAVEYVEETHGKLDVLYNNAGISGAQVPSADGGWRQLYHQHYDTNLFGAAVVTEAFLPLMKKGSLKRICFSSSDLGSLKKADESDGQLYSAANFVVYRSTKTALNMLMLYYAKSLQDEGFVVAAANPGYCATNLNGSSGMRDPRDGAKSLIYIVEQPKEKVHAKVNSDEVQEPW